MTWLICGAALAVIGIFVAGVWVGSRVTGRLIRERYIDNDQWWAELFEKWRADR